MALDRAECEQAEMASTSLPNEDSAGLRASLATQRRLGPGRHPLSRPTTPVSRRCGNTEQQPSSDDYPRETIRKRVPHHCIADDEGQFPLVRPKFMVSFFRQQTTAKYARFRNSSGP